MANRSFYTDRTGGPVPAYGRTSLRQGWRAIAALIRRRVEGNWLAQEFPEWCPDGNGISGTNHRDLSDTLEALVPELGWPLGRGDVPDTDTVLDLLDFLSDSVLPSPLRGAGTPSSVTLS